MEKDKFLHQVKLQRPIGRCRFYSGKRGGPPSKNLPYRCIFFKNTIYIASQKGERGWHWGLALRQLHRLRRSPRHLCSCGYPGRHWGGEYTLVHYWGSNQLRGEVFGILSKYLRSYCENLIALLCRSGTWGGSRESITRRRTSTPARMGRSQMWEFTTWQNLYPQGCMWSFFSWIFFFCGPCCRDFDADA